MHFAHWRPHDLGAARATGVFHDERRRQVADHDGRTAGRPDGPLRSPSARPPVRPSAQHRAHRKRERVVLSDRPPLLVHDREPVHVGIHGDPEVALVPPHQGAERLEVLRDRFRRPGEPAIGRQVDRGHAASQALEEVRHHDPARPADRVEGDTKPPPPNGADVESLERQDRIQMPLDRVEIRRRFSQRIVAGAPDPAVSRELPHARAGGAIEKDAVGADELEGVPFDGVVARGEHNPARGTVVLHGELDGGRRDEANVDHPAPDRHQAGRSGACEHGSGCAGITPQHDARRLALPPSPVPRPGLCPNAERRRPPGDDFGGEVRTDQAPHPRHAHHEGAGHQARRASIARTGRRSGWSWGVGMGSAAVSGKARWKASTMAGSNCTPFQAFSSSIACATEREGR